jgi:hypothetical protein
VIFYLFKKESKDVSVSKTEGCIPGQWSATFSFFWRWLITGFSCYEILIFADAGVEQGCFGFNKLDVLRTTGCCVRD